MVRVLHLLNADDKAIICRALRLNTARYSGAHEGLLPFIEIEEVLTALVQLSLLTHNGYRRIISVYYRLREAKPLFEEQILLHLDDGKVAKAFGKHPELGRPFKWLGLSKVTCGVKWSLPKRDYVPDTEVMVAPCVALMPVKRGLWEVICAEEHRRDVESWLVDHCR